jgi:hypothetical protein
MEETPSTSPSPWRVSRCQSLCSTNVSSKQSWEVENVTCPRVTLPFLEMRKLKSRESDFPVIPQQGSSSPDLCLKGQVMGEQRTQGWQGLSCGFGAASWLTPSALCYSQFRGSISNQKSLFVTDDKGNLFFWLLMWQHVPENPSMLNLVSGETGY